MKTNNENTTTESNMTQHHDAVQESISRDNEDTLARQAALEASQLRVPAPPKK